MHTRNAGLGPLQTGSVRRVPGPRLDLLHLPLSEWFVLGAMVVAESVESADEKRRTNPAK